MDVTTLDEEVEVRYWTQGGYVHRTVPISEVAAEIDFLKSTGKAQDINVRVVGADEWRKVGFAAL
jgi:hypothetical protein